MSGRKLGGGRIFGTGKGLAPPTPPSAPRASSPFAPSESTVSLGTPSLSPPASGSLPDLGPDIGSSISVGAQAKRSGQDATGLVCPICNEEMVTLLQLNQHIDDNHRELPEEEQHEVKTWFDKQVLKAKRFQPLTLINQKLRGLEVFESNESTPVPPQAKTSGRPTLDEPIDPDDLITRSHWQRINCRKCGRLFCEEHTMYQMKLSRSANHEPVRGYWARVCETCYKSREGYNDHTGKLETSRLEKRLTKLTRLLAGSSDTTVSASSGSLLGPVSSLIGQKDSRKLLEQSVVPWEEDEVVPKCPFCQQEFGSWTFRRHHCRICGRVVCADPKTACSTEVSLDVNSVCPNSEKIQANDGIDPLRIDIRMCRDCNHTIFSHRDFAASIQHRAPDQKAYETLCQFERGIGLLLPSFQRVLLALQPEKLSNGEVDLTKPPPTHAQIQEASKIRKRLIDSFGKYGAAAKGMRSLKTDSPTQKRLQEAVYMYASGFLHTHMLPLKSLPQMLRAHSTSARFLATPTHSSSSLRHTEVVGGSDDAGSQAPSEASTVVSQLESEEREFRERLAVLQEQKLMVQDMMSMAKGARRFEEVSALARNVDELDGEIGQLSRKVGEVEQRWEGVYRNGAPA
ncbi:FYVE zinc finger domain-containing protein [Hirsutella rhossiliensis]|uniref:FYVE zinc finger domain-containing protein n=1 Tax=Hirsutella rhossiliensis TaxID=111463 RepID=A0A9P8SIG3_9HYPO|nr:FYVE zinc finger domain-containing protein [Hirsutella rhossiliensis]KAH0961986.1 FYVE zinc finger domain-containing protein [Hirsutella rhossiliensis]